MTYHIIPENDLKPHIQESTCECNPEVTIVENGNMVIVHNSYDGREGLEMANEVLNF